MRIRSVAWTCRDFPNCETLQKFQKRQKVEKSKIPKGRKFQIFFQKIYAPSGRVGPYRSGENLDILETLERKAEGNVRNLETLELSLGEVIVAHPLADHAWGRTPPSPFPTTVCQGGGRVGGCEHICICIYTYTDKEASTHVEAHAHMHTHTRTSIFLTIHPSSFTHKHTLAYTYTRPPSQISTNLNTHMYRYLHTHLHMCI